LIFSKEITKEAVMEKTFIDALSYLNVNKDKESIMFLEYVLKKYFNDRKFFMPIKEAIPFLEVNDREQLTVIMEEVR
jgi:hypothetical protein